MLLLLLLYDSGDGEGQNEMNLSMGYLKDFLVAWRTEAEGVRVFFPDNVVGGGRSASVPLPVDRRGSSSGSSSSGRAAATAVVAAVAEEQ